MTTLGRLVEGLAHRLEGDGDVAIAAVTADSRRVRPGSLFVAVRGLSRDGHAFVAGAIEAGAAAVVVDADGARDLGPLTVPTAVVDRTDEAIGRIVRRLHGAPDRNLRVFAVTGTNGKTTVSHLVRDLLRALDLPCGLIGTIEYDDLQAVRPAPLTTPSAEDLVGLLAAVGAHGGAAVSMEASSHALDQGRLAGIEVDVAAYTNITRDHLDYHGDIESYVAAKRRLLDHLSGDERAKPAGRAVVYTDDPCQGDLAWPEGTVRVGSTSKTDVRAVGTRCHAGGIDLEVEIDGTTRTFRSHLIGSYNVANLLVTIGVAHAFGLDLDAVAAHFGALRPVPGRLEPVALDGGPLALVDYAHTPDGIESSLRAVRALGAGHLVVVFGCGGDRDRGKRPLMARAAIGNADRVVLTVDNPRTEDPERIFDDTMPGFAGATDRVERIDDRAEAIARALDLTGPEDVIVVCGKGHETYQIVGEETLPWDDREVLRNAWARRGATS